MQELNLRISEKIKLLIEGALEKDSSEKFFKELKIEGKEAHHEEITANMVGSLIHTLHLESLQASRKLQSEFLSSDRRKKDGYSVDDVLKKVD